MTEWHNSEVAAYDKSNQYDRLSNEKIQQLAGCLDTILENYVRGAGDKGSLSCATNTSEEKHVKMSMEYSDVAFNEYHEGAVTVTRFTLVRTDNMKGSVKEAYDVIVERQVAIDRISQQSSEGIANDMKTKRHDAFTEYYCLEKFPAGMYQAYVGRLNEVTRDGDIDYEDMRLYDVQYLVAELDKIVGLYDASHRDHVTIE